MQQVISELEGLRRRSRVMLVVQRASVMLAWMLGTVLALVIFDFVLRLPSGFRLVLLAAGVAALGYAVWGYLRSAVVFQPTLTQLALRVERVMPGVAGRLASSVEFATAGVDQSNQMAARTVRETQTRLAGESVSSVINSRRTWRDLGIMLVVAAVAAVLVIVDPSAAGTGLTRWLLPYSATQWPARTGVQSMMSGVLTHGSVHPRGQALPLRARVTKGVADQRVDAEYRLQVEGSYQPWQHIVLTHQGSGVHERLVDTNAEKLEVYFSTDDDQTQSETIDLVPPPAVRRASLTITPPQYAANRVPALEAELGQGLDDRAVTETASLIGSTANLRFELNKPLPVPTDSAAQSRWLKTTFGWDDSELPQFTADPSHPTSWTLRWRLNATRALSLNLVDEHGLSNSEQIAYRIEAVEDHPPVVTITKPQADEAVLASATVSLETQARDDVALASLGVDAHLQNAGRNADEAMAAAPVWENSQTVGDPTATVQADLNLAPLHLAEGDVVLVSGIASDVYQQDAGAQKAVDDASIQNPKSKIQNPHEVRSPLRRLRVISDMELATQLRRQLSAVRQNSIRIEALQAELQDDLVDSSVQPGVDRAQAQIGERIAGQRASVEDIERLVRENRLDDQQLGGILQQSHDLLDHAGRSANKAVESIEKRQSEKAPAKGKNTGGDQSQKPSAKSSSDQAGKPNAAGGSRQQQSPSGEKSPSSKGKPQAGENPQQPSQQNPQQAPQDSNPQSKGERPKPADLREPAPEDKPIVEAQQEVRDELADLIKLLDRDEDTWVVKQQLEHLLKDQAQLQAATSKLGQQTIGQKPEDLPEQQRTELDRIAQKQRDELRDEARKLIEQMRDRSKALEKVDPQSADSMRTAADTAEQRQLDRDMEEAAKHVEQNQMTSASAKQQSAQSTMQKMLNDIVEAKRAQARQLIRQLASLVESIQRLITVQENELTSLALAKDTNDFSGLDRSMIRLNQNTQSVAGEARAAGQEARRIARSLDRAADTQGAAVAALRAPPINAAEVEADENRSLEMLKEAKGLAEELAKKTQEEETQKRREELMTAYRKFAEQQVAVRNQTLPLAGIEQLDRRQLVDARRLGTAQDEIRTGLNQLRDVTSEILDSPIFTHVHRMIDTWSAAVSDSLANGAVNVDVTDRQQQIADSIGRLIKALEESTAPPDEFNKDQGKQQNQGQGQGQQPLIPPVAQLKLLQGLEEQVYNLTKGIDGRHDLDAAQRRERLRDLGQQQRELMDLGKKMLEALQSGQPPAPPAPDASPTPEKPDDQPEPAPDQPVQPPMPEPGS